MRIAINARLLIPGKLDGIGWFTWETFTRIFRSHPDVEFHLFFDRKPPEEFRAFPNVVCYHTLPPARRPWLFHLWLEYTIPWMLKRVKADLFVSPDGLGTLAGTCPQLAVIHDINFVRHPGDMPKAYSDYYNTLTGRLVKHASRLATVSAFSRNEIVCEYGVSPEIIDIIPNAASDRFQPISQEEARRVRSERTSGAPYFLFVGSIHPRKNIPRLLEAFDAFLSNHGTDHRLMIAGTTFWMFEPVEKALESMKHRDRVVFTGRLTGEELPEIVAASEGLTFMSYYEGFGIPLLEAFQCGVPVLTSKDTAMEEVAAGAALLADPFSVEAIAEGLSQLTFNHEVRNELVQKGLQRATAFSWDHSADLLWQSIMRTLQ
jgi:glycosyltransferase involved in cell wall biosynthesis